MQIFDWLLSYARFSFVDLASGKWVFLLDPFPGLPLPASCYLCCSSALLLPLQVGGHWSEYIAIVVNLQFFFNFASYSFVLFWPDLCKLALIVCCVNWDWYQFKREAFFFFDWICEDTWRCGSLFLWLSFGGLIRFFFAERMSLTVRLFKFLSHWVFGFDGQWSTSMTCNGYIWH